MVAPSTGGEIAKQLAAPPESIEVAPWVLCVCIKSDVDSISNLCTKFSILNLVYILDTTRLLLLRPSLKIQLRKTYTKVILKFADGATGCTGRA
jgi:hypothetical protein